MSCLFILCYSLVIIKCCDILNENIEHVEHRQNTDRPCTCKVRRILQQVFFTCNEGLRQNVSQGSIATCSRCDGMCSESLSLLMLLQLVREVHCCSVTVVEVATGRHPTAVRPVTGNSTTVSCGGIPATSPQTAAARLDQRRRCVRRPSSV